MFGAGFRVEGIGVYEDKSCIININHKYDKR